MPTLLTRVALLAAQRARGFAHADGIHLHCTRSRRTRRGTRGRARHVCLRAQLAHVLLPDGRADGAVVVPRC
eukprot:4821018-Lingulodinium_polyedra.AAC.1